MFVDNFFDYFCTHYWMPLVRYPQFGIRQRMNKTLLILAVLGLLTLFTSAYYSAPADSRIGYKAPSLVLGDKNNDLSPLQQQRGENVLLSFWSSDDPESRLRNLYYDRLVRNIGRVVHVSVNLDRSESVYNAILEVDDLDRSTHFHSSTEVRESIIKSWRLEEGYHSFLLDDEGRIIGIDPNSMKLISMK